MTHPRQQALLVVRNWTVHPSVNEEFYGHGGFSCRKSPKFPRAHKIGAAISGPRTAGESFYGHGFFSEKSDVCVAATPSLPPIQIILAFNAIHSSRGLQFETSENYAKVS